MFASHVPHVLPSASYLHPYQVSSETVDCKCLRMICHSTWQYPSSHPYDWCNCNVT